MSLLQASSLEYQKKAVKLHLWESRYWNLLLHMVDGESEIDDPNFFFAKDGKTNAKNELNATLDALLHETRFDDNASACKFPARTYWLAHELNITDLPEVHCTKYNKILKRLAPKSATLVFPSAHINSPASMFGHTFIRINSRYKSKLLAYAINYAADADPTKENGTIFAIKGLFGGYYGNYSLLPYSEKLKEYRDSEQRDIWEYDLDLNKAETLSMVRHIWELNGTHSRYYFLTENCSYNMLWLIEIARPSLYLREHFHFEVIPLETIHVVKEENIIIAESYRPSKRTTLLKYEELIESQNIHYVKELVNSDVDVEKFLEDTTITMQQEQYILEASIEYLEYSYSKTKMSKEQYLKIFHTLTKSRAILGKGNILKIETPNNPIISHRAIRTSIGAGVRDGKGIGFLGLRPAYHDLEDSDVGFLRGTQIEFLTILLSYNKETSIELEKATLLSIASITQRSEFFSGLSWRMHTGWDKNSFQEKSNFTGSVGVGFGIGNKFAYIYALVEPFFYITDTLTGGAGATLGLVIDKYKFMSTNIEATQRLYDTGRTQSLVHLTQSFRLSQNFQMKLQYTYKDRYSDSVEANEQTYRAVLNYYY